MTSLAVRPKGPQPVLDSLIGAPDSSLHDDPFQRNLHATIGLNLQLHVPPVSNGLFQIPTPAPLPPVVDATTNGTIPGLPSLSHDDRPKLLRAKSDFGPRRLTDPESADTDSKSSSETEWGIRHGFATQLVSEEYNHVLTSNFFLYFTDKKHETGGNPKEIPSAHTIQEWRMKDRLKTVSAVLALCLNIGVDPPDVIKTSPCAKEECWIDPAGNQNTGSGNAPLNSIGKALQTQYEALSIRTRYKCALDPTVEETRKYAIGLRKNARNERVLFHYNGHGVPKPTSSGEIWVFNRNYTQYIPISLYDLQAWINGPSIFVWDCSDAGLIIQNFMKFAEKHEADNIELSRRDPNGDTVDCSDCIHLAACKERENLPTNPDLPADVFTACLTTPIRMAVKFFILQNPLRSTVTLQDALQIPGSITERRTPLGELNWIFTAITDSIAWDALPKRLFKKLFRQDLMVAALYRNFLLAQRIMRKYHCTPQSYPDIPPTHNHPLWQSWDLAVETMLAQLPDLLAHERGEKHYEYQHSTFFAEQLTAFEVYLSQDAPEHKIPEQLPVVLQVLLSQVHRLRALILLSKFLDLGPWAVNLALGIGIFPYVLKLLQSQAMELKPVMVFIWARVLAVDISCQTDLLKDNGYQYFVQILNPAGTGIHGVGNVSEHRAMCAFIIAMFCKDFHQGQNVCLSQELIESCLSYFDDMQNPLLRQWSCLCLSMLWVNFPDAKWAAIKCSAHQRLCDLVVDCVAEVRAAMLHALTSFLGIPDLTAQVAHIEESVASMVLIMASDGSAMVRKELLVFFSTFIVRYQNRFIVAAYEQLVEERKAMTNPVNGDDAFHKPSSDRDDDNVSGNTIFSAVWKEVLIMSVDPHPEIAENASTLVDYVFDLVLDSQLAAFALPIFEVISIHRKPAVSKSTFVEVFHPPHDRSRPPTPPTPSKEGYFAAGLKRTASYAASLTNFAFGAVSPPEDRITRSKGRQGLDKHPAVQSKLNGELNRPPDEKDLYHSPSHPPLRTPTPRSYRPRSKEQKQTIPLESKFFEWSVEYFREPQMQPPEAEEPGSTDYNGRLWRRNRNDRIIAKTQPQKEMAGTSPWDKPKGFWNNGTQPVKLCWHQFEDQLVITDDKDGVSVWDWKQRVRLNQFSNGNPARSKITEVRLINEDDQAFLMTGSSDGVIKIFRGYESPRNVELVTAFRALTDLEPSNKSAGLVFDWQQGRGQILVAGDVRSIRVWNAGTEICTCDINARSGSPVTSLTSDQVEGNLFAAGFGDGALRLYDQREKPQTALVRVWKEHKAWLTNVHLQRGGQRELVTASRDGYVKLWDLRWDRSIRTLQAAAPSSATGGAGAGLTAVGGTHLAHPVAHHREGLRVLAVHEHAPVLAVGTEGRAVRIFSTSGVPLTTFEPSMARFIGAGPSGVSAVAFHPHRMIVAAAAVGDSHVNLFACGKKGEKEI